MVQALVLVALGLSPVSAWGQPTDDAVKAAFLPRFARYVTWPAPPPPGAPIQLCVIGRDPFGPLLDRAAGGEVIDGHAVTVRRVATAERAGGCNLAFVAGAAPQDTMRLLLALRDQPVLTITDARAGAERGIIHFAVIAGRVRFFIDDAEAAHRGLTISSRLLAIAAGVRERR